MIFCSYCSDGLDAGTTHCPRCFRPAGPVDQDPVGTLEPLSYESAAEALRAADIALIQADAEAKLVAEIERVRAEAAHQRATELALLRAEAHATREATIAQVRATAEAETRGALAAELAKARSEAEKAFAIELARVRAEAEHTMTSRLKRAEEEAERVRNTQLALAAAEADAARAAAVEEARGAADGHAARTEDADDIHVIPATAASEIPVEWQQGGATYTLELPARCPYCREIIRTLRVLRLKRSQAAFTSPLPRGGRAILCSACDGILSADLSTL